MKLVGVLLAGALVLGLAMFAVDKVNDPGPSAAEKAGLDVSVSPSAPDVAVDAEECVTARRAITGAEDSYHAQYSRYADVTTLILAGNLAGPTALYRIESTDGFVTYQLTSQAGCP